MAMIEDYRSALRAGQRAYRACVARGQSPYLAVLDDILNGVNIVAQEPLGLVDIPAESIVGTKTSGRHTAFAANFMPLLEEDTEFAIKWSNLCEAHLEEGIHTPIIAYEYLNKFYVQEGNKRVSVLKYYEAVTIPGTVTRLVPARDDTLENKIYYEFLDFYKLSKINNVQFSRLGGYAKLQTLVCKAASEVWSDDDRLNFSALYTMFSQQFYALGGSALELTPGDALLVYLSVYRYSDACQSTPSQVRENLAKLWDEIKILTEPHAVELSLEPKPGSEPLLNKLNIFSKPSQLKVVFLHEYNAKNSAWVRGHEKGIEALKKEFPDRLVITNRENVSPEVDAEQIMEEVAHDNADVVFTTTPKLMPATLKAAVTWPQVKFLNCSLHMTHPYVRTYYGRIHEAKFILGAIAGSMAQDGRLGYIASYPTYGMTAGVNAFALGAQLVNPRAAVYVDWTARRGSDIERDFKEKGIRIISNVDMNPPAAARERFGLYEETPQGVRHLAMPLWNWGEFYTKILRSIFDGTWRQAETQPGAHAVNYWWGLSAGVVDVLCSHSLPQGTLRLAELLKNAIAQGMFEPFSGPLYSQQGPVQQAGGDQVSQS